MSLDNHWFSELCLESGSAFSLKITEKLHEEQTPYQRIEIYATEHFGNLMVIDGFIMLSDKDNFIYHEMMSHPALFCHPNPQRVVIIGGGDCGTLQEVLKHQSVAQAWQVEIDERVTRLAEQYFPALCQANQDARARFLFDDGIQWVKNAEADSLDVIIVDSTDPIGPAEGLFTEAFYRDCARALGDQGVFVQQSESPLIHKRILVSMHQAMGAAGWAHTQTFFFPQCVYPTGWWSCTMASQRNLRQHFRENAAAAKPFSTEYYNAGIHHAALAMPEFFQRWFDNP